MSELLLRAGWCLTAAGSLWACWELRSLNNRVTGISYQNTLTNTRLNDFARGVVCERGTCVREELRAANGDPAHLTLPMRTVV